MNEEMIIDQRQQKYFFCTNEMKEIELELMNLVNATIAKSIIITPKSRKGANIKKYIDNKRLMFGDTE